MKGSCLLGVLLAGMMTQGCADYAGASSATPEESAKAAKEIETAFPSGGVSVDFSKFHDPDGKEVKTSGGNLLPNGGFENGLDEWRADFWTYQDKRNEPIADMGVRKVSTDKPFKGKYCAELGMPDEAAARRPEGRSFSNNLNFSFDNDDGKKQEYLLSFYCRGQKSERPGKLSVYITYQNKDKKSAGPHFWGEAVRWDSPGWEKNTFAFTAPEGTVKAHVQLRFTDFGRAWIDEVCLEKATSAGLSAALLPNAFIDDTYHLSSGQAGIMNIGVKTSSAKPAKSAIHLLLPKGVDVIGVKTSILGKTEVKKNGTDFVEYSIDAWSPQMFGQSHYKFMYGQMILIKTNLPSSDKPLDGAYWVSSDERTSPPREFKIKIDPRAEGARPNVFMTGGHTWNDIKFNEKASDMIPLADLYAGVGFNIIQMNGVSKGEAKISKELKNRRVHRYSQELGVNGYTFWGKVGEDEKFRRVDGSWGENGVCPVAIYQKGKLFEETIVPKIKELVAKEDLTDGIMCNWEPFMYDAKGCFCPKCKEEFVKYSKLPAAEVEKEWPGEIISKHKDMWVKFRSWQHAKLLLVLEEAVSGIGKIVGKESHFVPEVHNSLTFKDNKPYSEYDVRDYLGKLPVVEPWGPYLFSQFTYPYSYKSGAHLRHLSMVSQGRDYADEYSKGGMVRTKIIAFPNGAECDDWIQEPEAIVMEHLSCFLSGWDGSIIYFFPYGYDARYWRAMAEANTLTAQNEDFVFNGKKICGEEKFSAAAETPAAGVPKRNSWTDEWDKKRIDWEDGRPSMIQRIEYRLGEKRLLAVGNFWQKGEVFARIIPKGLKDGKYVLRQPLFNRCFTGADGSPALTKADLEKGVLVQVGALRWAAFVLEPWQEGIDYGARISPAQMEGLKNLRLAGIKKALDEENSLVAKEAEFDAVPDFSKFQEMKSGEVSCALEKKGDGSGNNVIVSWPGSKIVVDANNGGKITSWELNGSVISKGLCSDGLWWPKEDCRMINGPYEFAGQEKTPDGISLTFSKKLSPGVYGYNVGGLKLVKTYSFSKGKISVRAKFENPSDHASEFSFRFHNLLALTKGGKGEKWTLEAPSANSGVEVADPAKGDIQMFRLKDADKEMDSNYPKKFARISKSDFSMKIQDSDFSMRMKIPGGEQVYGFLLWGFSSGGVPGTTLEPIFDKATIAQGQNWSAEMTWEVAPAK